MTASSFPLPNYPGFGLTEHRRELNLSETICTLFTNAQSHQSIQVPFKHKLYHFLDSPLLSTTDLDFSLLSVKD